MPEMPAFSFLALLAFVFSAGEGSPKVGDVSREHKSILSVPNGAHSGKWTEPEMCPEGYNAYGFSLKVQDSQGKMRDDTGLNGIRLHCSQEESIKKIQDVESESGRFGTWTTPIWCPEGFLNSFALQVESSQGRFLDDTAANSIKFTCSGDHVVEGQGTPWGHYGAWSETCQKAICGLETRLEKDQTVSDNTGLNDVRFYCCI